MPEGLRHFAARALASFLASGEEFFNSVMETIPGGGAIVEFKATLENIARESAEDGEEQAARQDRPADGGAQPPVPPTVVLPAVL